MKIRGAALAVGVCVALAQPGEAIAGSIDKSTHVDNSEAGGRVNDSSALRAAPAEPPAETRGSSGATGIPTSIPARPAGTSEGLVSGHSNSGSSSGGVSSTTNMSTRTTPAGAPNPTENHLEADTTGASGNREGPGLTAGANGGAGFDDLNEDPLGLGSASGGAASLGAGSIEDILKFDPRANGSAGQAPASQDNAQDVPETSSAAPFDVHNQIKEFLNVDAINGLGQPVGLKNGVLSDLSKLGGDTVSGGAEGESSPANRPNSVNAGANLQGGQAINKPPPLPPWIASLLDRLVEVRQIVTQSATLSIAAIVAGFLGLAAVWRAGRR